MKKVAMVIVLTLLLSIGNTVVSIFLSGIYGLTRQSKLSTVFYDIIINGVLPFAVIKLIYYGLFHALLLNSFNKIITIRNSLGKLILLNSISYLIYLSVFAVFAPRENIMDVISNIIFQMDFIAIFISPVLLYRIPYFKKDINSMMQQTW